MASRVIIPLLTLVVGFVLGVWFFSASSSPPATRALTSDVRDKVLDSSFTNPLFECAELPESISVGERIGLEREIEALIESKKEEGAVTEAAVYFRDLNNGPWFGIKEEHPFSPASLLKVPLAMWYYWKADTDPGILDQEIEFTGPPGVSIVHFEPKEKLVPGTTYRIEDLVRIMLQQSDNDAAMILAQFAGSEETSDVYRDFGIEPLRDVQTYTTTVHTFASFFRVLYNATYLGRSLSEHMLEMMSSSSFTEGIVAGVPQDVRVAHKFGERQLGPESYQLHDCGIVYAGENPYSLCIMTQGSDYNKLAAFIEDVSALVYEEVAN